MAALVKFYNVHTLNKVIKGTLIDDSVNRGTFGGLNIKILFSRKTRCAFLVEFNTPSYVMNTMDIFRVHNYWLWYIVVKQLLRFKISSDYEILESMLKVTVQYTIISPSDIFGNHRLLFTQRCWINCKNGD